MLDIVRSMTIRRWGMISRQTFALSSFGILRGLRSLPIACWLDKRSQNMRQMHILRDW